MSHIHHCQNLSGTLLVGLFIYVEIPWTTSSPSGISSQKQDLRGLDRFFWRRLSIVFAMEL
ncbi:hypothetical protein NC651_009479 [Populus alba x Populus x berolinensis]|nr:hypothetical protein NC651_009479 [Populus alba x Populus x berolinensis]